MEDKVQLISLFFSKQRVYGDSHLNKLLELDNLWKTIYEEHRRYDFSNASLLANEAVVREILTK